MNAVAEFEPNHLVPADTVSLMDVIGRAAADPNTDVSKLERLLAMYERIKASEAQSAFTEALIAAQQEIPAIPERGKILNRGGGVQSTYALWEDMNDILRPILARHGLALSFRTGREDGKITVTGVLRHKLGHKDETTIYLPADTSGSKNDVQGVGSSTSYGKRYTTQALLNMTSRGEDDDGQKGGASGKITEAQAKELIAACAANKAPLAKFCDFMKVENVQDIAVKDFDRAIQAIRRYGAPR